MTDIKTRAQELLTCDELRGRVPEEVRQFLHDIVALEPVGCAYKFAIEALRSPDCNVETLWSARLANETDVLLYDIGAPNDPA